MSQQGVNLAQFLQALKSKAMPLQFEMGTFIVLEVCERVLMQPRKITAAQVWLSEEGEIALAAGTGAESEEAVSRSLVELLGDVLVQSAPGVPAHLLSIVERGPSDGEWGLRTLRDDLEAALVPLNRAATRRVLARLLREGRRERERARSRTAPEAGALDSELDDLLGLDEEEALAAARVRSDPPEESLAGSRPVLPAHDDDAASLEEPLDHTDQEIGWENVRGAEPDDEFSEQRTVHWRPSPQPVEGAAPYQTVRLQRGERDLPDDPDAQDELDGAIGAEPGGESSWRPRDYRRARLGTRRDLSAPRVQLRDSDFEGLDESSTASRTGVWIGLGLAVLAIALAVGYALVGREGARAALGIAGGDEPAPRAPPAAAAPQGPERGRLVVSSKPARAQVLMYVGRGPAIVEDLPIGVAHEFVALADGARPARAVVPSDAAWQQQDGAKRYELALQTTPLSGKSSKARRGKEDLGATKLSQDVGRPSGEYGSVRVITSPPQAKVYQLIGFTPDATVQDIDAESPVELLLYLRGRKLAKVDVTRDDYHKQDGKLVAQIDVELDPE